MKIAIAIDSFKNSISSEAANKVVLSSFSKVMPDNSYEMYQISDGGEGLVYALTSNIINVEVMGPKGNKVKSYIGLLDNNKTAVIEISSASGIELIKAAKFSAKNTTTFGFGELIKKALDLNVNKIIIGLGGSATNDMGLGALRALGAKFYDSNKKNVSIYGKDLFKVKSVDINKLDLRLKSVEIIIAADVNNPLYGFKGASHIYGKQKGLSLYDRIKMDKAFKRVSQEIIKSSKNDFRYYPGAGAAGGLGFSLLTFTNSTLTKGFDLVSAQLDLFEKLKGVDILITGEGKIDNQTINGKAPYAIAKLAKSISPKCQVYAFCGLTGKTNKLIEIDKIININEFDLDSKNWINNTKENLESSATKLAKDIIKQRSMINKDN